MRAKAWRMLFAGRRWMLWLPVPASVWLALPEWQHIPAMLLGGLIVWIPSGSRGGSVMASRACPGGREPERLRCRAG
jgi:hypothetical protein